ncbi:MAG: hypothetical protein AAFQ64_15485 [Pseudomonadota bacterium]
MMKPAILVMSTLMLSACMGASIETPAETVTLGKGETLSTCPEITGISAQYARSVEGLPFRCGPQTQSPVTYQ